MLTAIKVWENHYDVDERASEETIRKAIARSEPYFFQKIVARTREAYTYYRGCIVCSFTASGTGWKERCHVPYLVCQGGGGTFCLNLYCKTKGSAKACIDRVLETGIARE